MRYFIALYLLDHISVTVLSSYNKIGTIVPDSNNGHYCLSIGGLVTQRTPIYCPDLDISSPKSFLSADPDENYSFSTYPSKSNGYIKYKKPGIDVDNVRFKAYDDTFTNREMIVDNEDPGTYSYPVYGKAWGCRTTGIGSLSINLSGTGFFI